MLILLGIECIRKWGGVRKRQRLTWYVRPQNAVSTGMSRSDISRSVSGWTCHNTKSTTSIFVYLLFMKVPPDSWYKATAI